MTAQEIVSILENYRTDFAVFCCNSKIGSAENFGEKSFVCVRREIIKDVIYITFDVNKEYFEVKKYIDSWDDLEEEIERFTNIHLYFYKVQAVEKKGFDYIPV